MAIRVTSFDFDGCLFHRDYLRSANKDVVTANKTLLDGIKEESQSYTQTIAFIGSNRQSLVIDSLNSLGKGSCFPAIKKVSDYLGYTFDSFLLADIYGDLPAGTSYERAMQSFTGSYTGSHSDWLFDETKASLIYAQMHKIAMENPNEPIIFDFYDDRGCGQRAEKDILEELHEFFSNNAELLPPNITLCLNHYAGNTVTPKPPIKGKTGNIIDVNYQQTVKDMTEITKQKDPAHDGINTPLYVTHHVVANELLHRQPYSPTETNTTAVNTTTHSNMPIINLEEITPHPQPQEAAEEELSLWGIDFTPRMVRFYEQLEIIEKKARQLRDDGQITAADQADELHQTLYNGSVRYFNERINNEQFAEICHEAIDKARSELEPYPGWKQVLANLTLAIVGLGIGYVVAGLLNKAITGHFLFFRTDIACKLDEMEQTVNQIVPVVA